MKLQDIADMKDYLENRCYCPHEIYDISGFFFELFHPEADCEIISSGSRGAIHGMFVVTRSEQIGNIDSKEYIVYIEITDNKVDSCVRLDNTPNNREQIIGFIAGKIDKMSFDEYEIGSTQKAIDEIMSTADAIMLS